MKFELDEEKNLINFEKHEVWFEEAQTIWADPLSVEYYDPKHSDDEDRFLRIDHFTTSVRLLIVAFCERDGDDLI